MSSVGKIFEIQHFALYDGPGVRTVIYLKGCPLRCLWCHNPEGQKLKTELFFHREKCVGCGICAEHCSSAARVGEGFGVDRELCSVCGECEKYCPHSAPVITGRTVSVEEMLDEIESDRPFFKADGGVTLSGGEPLMQADFSYALLSAAKEKGIHTCVESCGFAPADALERLASVTDLFLYDIKELDPERHREMTGVDNKTILENLKLLDRLGKRVIIRAPIIPAQNMRNEHFVGIAELAQSLSHVEAIELEPYHPLGLAKYAALGLTPPLVLGEFLEPSALCEFIPIMLEYTDKPVRLSNGEPIC